jgi:hypothetical protein
MHQSYVITIFCPIFEIQATRFHPYNMASPHFSNVQHKRLTLLLQTLRWNGKYALIYFFVLLHPIGCDN